MKLVKKRPVTSGSRHLINIDKSLLLKTDKIFNAFLKHNYRNGRSTVTGHITSWHRGGGCKSLYRKIESDGKNKFSLVLGVSYDPNRSAFVSNNFDFNLKQFYNSISIINSLPGSLIKQFEDSEKLDAQLYAKNKQIMTGYRTKLQEIPVGSIINSISLKKNSKIKYVKSAGSRAQLIRIDKNYASVKLCTGKLLFLSREAVANVGVVTNDQHNLIVYGKAGRKRHLNRRPIVRGIAMNPVDHPHGGRSNGGRHSCSPWGILTKGKFKLKKRKIMNRKKKYESI